MQTTWRPILIEETRKPYFQDLQRFVAEQRAQVTVFPPELGNRVRLDFC
ncbi:MAG: hypothetical protein ABL856_02735 [Gallionella sp.]